MNNKIDIFKIRTVKTPKRNRYDAGTDFFVPEFDEQFILDFKVKNPDRNSFISNGQITIPPGGQANIPSGIVAHIQDPDTYWDAENKSGVATKRDMLVGAQVIDATYSGEIHINLHNVGGQTQYIYPGDKLVQFIHKEYRNSDLNVYDDKDKFYALEWPGERGDKGFGEGTGNN